MRSVSPVIHFESSEAKNTAAGEMLHSRAASLFVRRCQFLLVRVDHRRRVMGVCKTFVRR
jgi:hypothetical protein